MSVVDVNVLIALFLNDHSHHDRARRWWASLQESQGEVSVPDLVWVGFLRLVTSPRAFPAPRTFEEAWSFVEAVLASGCLRPSASGEPVMRALMRVASTTTVRGNLVTDAYIAAVAVSLGVSVVTFDRDFRKLDGVRVIEPH